MNSSVFWSSYDSASSRAHAPHAGAALKSSKMGRNCSFAAASVRSMSLLQFTPIIRLLREMCCYNLELQLQRQLDRARAADLVQRVEAAVCAARAEAGG